MAEEKPNTELEDLAFEIYSKRIAAAGNARHADAEALDCFRKAEAFLKVRASVRKGETKTVHAPSILADVHAPNLKRTHPHNLVSQKMGNLSKVKEINDWLNKNPTPETEPEELVSRLREAFSDLGWDLPTINTARAIFPAYCKN
jgi:hypothetical protein